MPASSYNPYEAPRAQPVQEARTSDRAPGETLKWIYGGLAAASLVASVARLAGAPNVQLVSALVAIFQVPVTATWIFQSWNGVPPAFRGGVSPAGAIGRFLVPFYGVYWFLVVNARLAAALDRALASAHLPPRAPRTLAWFAPLAHVAATGIGALFVFAPALREHSLLSGIGSTTTAALVDAIWFLYMLRCDEVRREVARTSPRTDKLASFWLPFALVAFALLFFLALWQFLSPDIPRPAAPGDPRGAHTR